MSWSRLQSASGNYPGGTTFFPSATYGSNVSSGTKLLCVVAVMSSLSGINAVGDGASGGGNQLTLISSFDGAGNYPTLALYAMDTPSGDVGTKPTITVSLANKSNCSVLIQEISGLAAGTAGITDGTAGSANGVPPSGAMGPPSYASSAASEYLLYAYADDEGNAATSNVYTWTAPGTYTADPASLNSQGTGTSFVNNLAVAYRNSTNGTETGAWSASGTGSAHWSELMVAFKLAGGGSASADAGDATGTGAAGSAAAGIGDNAGDATGTGAALGASAGPGVSAGDATGSGAVPSALLRISVPGGVAGGDGTALPATAASNAAAASAGLAAGAGAAFGATAGLPAAVRQGSWWQLDSILKERAEYASYYRSQVPVACPNDGVPLLDGPPGEPAVKYCPHDGWQFPRDFDPIVHSGM